MRHHCWAGLCAAFAIAALASVAGAEEREVRPLDFGVLDPALLDAGAPVTREAGYHQLPSLRDVSVICGPAIGLIIEVGVPPAASAGTPRVVNLMSLDDPGITADDYAIVGMVEYGGLNGSPDMDGVGYLEMWSEFADGSRYFTRTLADAGELRRLSGHSTFRPFRLPFHADAAHRPTRLILNLCLPGVARVRLSDMKLVQQESPPTQHAVAVDASPPWWTRAGVTETATGLFGFVGCLGFAEPLIRRGRARGLVLMMVVAVGVLGEAYVCWAMVRAGHGERWRAWSPMLLCGIVGLCVPACIPIVNRRYRDVELRRMRALDAVAV